MRLRLPARRVRNPANRVINGFPASAALNSLMVRSQIIGRDGSVVTTRATQRTNPLDGSLLANNVPATTVISLGGWPVTMYGCWGQRTNLKRFSDLTNADNTANAVTKSVSGAYCRITEDTSSAGHRLTSASTFAPAGSTVHTASVRVSGTSTANYATLTIGAPWVTTRTVAIFNLTTLAVTWSGQDASATAKVIQLGPGIVLCSLTFTTIASPTASEIAYGMSRTGAESYTGDGATFLDFNFAQLEAATFPGPYIPTAGSAVTHNAEDIVYTPNVAPGQNGEYTAFAVGYLWSGGGIPGLGAQRLFEDSNATNNALYYFGGNTAGQILDSLGVQSVGANTLPNGTLASGQITYRSLIYGGGSHRISAASVLGGAVSDTPAYSLASSIRIGNRSALDFPFFGFVGLIYTPNGVTAAERAALQSLLPASVSFSA